MPDGDTPIYGELVDKLLFDPLPPIEVVDDHDLTAVDPGWFEDFDEVDSRRVPSVGGPD